MRYVAAYLLAALGGNGNPEAGDIKKILDSVGIEADSERLGKVRLWNYLQLNYYLATVSKVFNVLQVLSELKGKNVEEVIAAGKFN